MRTEEVIEGARIVLTAYTASFRVPGFMGHQLTLPVPPLSTVYGLISAAVGRWVQPEEVEWLAYRFEYKGKSIDLEAIVTVARSKEDQPAKLTGRNILQREFLTSPCLTLYLPREWKEAFQRPRYTLLLGRTQDVAAIESIVPVTLEPVDEGEVSGVLLPLTLVTRNFQPVPAWLHNLPIAFTAEPRRLRGMAVFGAVDARRHAAWVRAPGWLVRDPETQTVVPLYRRDWVLETLGLEVKSKGIESHISRD